MTAAASKKIDKKQIGARLRTLRLSRGKDQAELAEIFGLATSSIGMYERGERMPRDDKKIEIAEYFKMDVQDLFY